MTHPFDDDPGIALLVTVLTTLVVSALAGAIVLTTSSEVLIGSAFRAAQQAMYSAEAAAEWCVADVAAPTANWAAITAGAAQSGFAEGPQSGARLLADGTSVDLGTVVASNPGWHMYAWGALDDLLPDWNRGSQFYVIALTSADGLSPDRMKIRALAFGPRGARHVVEVAAVKGTTGVRIDSWLETR
jgi:hypothetical protein